MSLTFRVTYQSQNCRACFAEKLCSHNTEKKVENVEEGAVEDIPPFALRDQLNRIDVNYMLDYNV